MNNLIFIADDDADDIELFCEALHDIDPSVIIRSSCNGSEMLAILNKEQEQLPAIILLDVNMPGMTGWQCLSFLKQHAKYKVIPVILYSTSSLQKEKMKALEMGACDFITKPDDYNKLKKVVGHLLDSIRLKA